MKHYGKLLVTDTIEGQTRLFLKTNDNLIDFAGNNDTLRFDLSVLDGLVPAKIATWQNASGTVAFLADITNATKGIYDGSGNLSNNTIVTDVGFNFTIAGSGAYLLNTTNTIDLLSSSNLTLDSGNILSLTATVNVEVANNNFAIVDGVNLGNLITTTLTADRTYTLPDVDGTIALLSDINSSNDKIGNLLIVSSQGTTIALGAERELIGKHFSSLVEAISVAVSGDTIKVYPGVYNGSYDNLYKEGVTWDLEYGAILNYYLFNDGGVQTSEVFNILGEGTLYTPGIAIFNLSGLNNKIYIELYKWTSGSNNPTAGFTNQNGIIIVKTSINLISNINQLNFLLNTNLIIYADEIIHTTTNTNSFYGVIMFHPDYSGNTIINARRITSNGGGTGLIKLGHNSGSATISGSVTINANLEHIVSSPSTFKSAVWLQSDRTNFAFTLNGDILTNCNAICCFQYSNGKVIHNGKIRSIASAIDIPLVWCQFSSTNNILELKGEYINDGISTNMISTDNILNKFILDDLKIIDNYTGVSTGLRKAINIYSVVKLIVNNVKVLMNIAIGTQESISTDSATDIKVLQSQFSSNVPVNVNINNVITGTNIIIDSEIE